MFNKYYDLRSDKLLPLNGTFVDPFDNEAYYVKPHEILDDFIKRIEVSRDLKKHPQFYPHQLKILVVISLAEHANKATLDKYFELKAAIPSVSEVISLAKVIAAQYKTRSIVPYPQRQERADKCNSCSLQKKKGLVNAKISSAIGRFAGLKEVVESKVEQNLGICGMCGCSLQKKVKFNILPALAEVSPEQLGLVVSAYGSRAFDKCWILNESLEHGTVKNLLTGKIKAIGPTAESLLTAYITEKQQAAKNANNIP